jgi:hypothetical protein
MFRSPGARPSPRIAKNQIPEGPIHDFTTVIDNTVPEDWQRRTAALSALVATIPSTSSGYYHQDSTNGNGNHGTAAGAAMWYNSPPTIRHLARPLSELLKDPRSTVVKRTCESCDELFSKCQVDARYLLKDLMPTVLQVHASTVQVIRSYVQATVLEALAVVPCKMAMPIWLDRLKNDKSRTVREACCIYLSTALAEWTEEGYLTKEIYLQVGTALIKALRDSSPTVRSHAKKGLETFHAVRGDLFHLLGADDRELARDVRIQKLLDRIKAGEAVGDDNMSVASRSSRVSVASAPVRGYRPGTSSSSVHVARNAALLMAGRPSQRHYGADGTNNRGSPPSTSMPRLGIPATIGVSKTPSPDQGRTKIPSPSKTSRGGGTEFGFGGAGGGVGTGGGGLGPPKRVIAVGSNDTTSSTRTVSNGLTTPAPFSSNAAAAPPFQTLAGDDGAPYPPPTLPGAPSALSSEGFDDDNENAGNQSFDTTETDMSELHPISSTTELRQVAKTRGMTSRRSSLLQDRLMRSSSSALPSTTMTEGSMDKEIHGMSLLNGGREAVVDAPNAPTLPPSFDVSNLPADTSENIIANHPGLPEHTKIAHELLEAHKIHVDQVMEVLKVEMDALKDFELILLEEGPRRPTEEEVLEYFESLGLCLEQRTKAATLLQKKMDRISKGKQ